VAQDLADGLVGAAIIALGTGLLGLESLQAAALEAGEQLIITLATVAVFSSHGADVIVEAFPFQEHEEAAGRRVVREQVERAGGAVELVGGGVEGERLHGKAG